LGRTGTIRFKGSTPLGTSAGVDEAIHYVDSIIEPSETTKKYSDMFKNAGDGTLRFNKDMDYKTVKSKNDEKLMALWRKSRRYDGKGCMDAVRHVETVLADAFVGKRITKLGTLLETDRELLGLELREAISAGRITDSAPAEEKIHAMQRKGVLGMNAILSVSLALGRAIAASNGKELWQLIREMAGETMAKFVEANANGQKKSLAELRTTDFDELKTIFREAAEGAINDGKNIYELLRAQLPVYPV